MTDTVVEVSICIGCGLCCDGTLFSRGKLTRDEASRTPVAHTCGGGPAGDEVSFRQPCVNFEGGSCRIYLDRYATCREYECKLLMASAKGAVDPATARIRIAKAHELIAAVICNDPEARTWSGRQKRWVELADALKSGSEAERRALGRRLLNLAVLEKFLDQHFRKRPTEPDSLA